MKYLTAGNRTLRHFIASPFIFIVVVPLVILDLFVELYHHIAFPLYGLTKVKRGEYIKFDRHQLDYLNIPQKIFCSYCSYANGAFAYFGRIAGVTESYWCGIQSQKDPEFKAPPHHAHFAAYGDKEDFEKKYVKPVPTEVL